MSKKHTPGPWRFDQPQHDEFRVLSCDQVVASLHEPYAYDTGAMDEIEANAAHIIHCVNMHDGLVEACEAAIGYVSDFIREYDIADLPDSNECRLFKQLRAALVGEPNQEKETEG